MSELIIVTDLQALADQINTEHTQAQEAMRSSLDHARHCGELLIQAKAQVNHGEWLPWLAGNCQFSDRTARAYMRVANNWPELEKSATVANLTYRQALELLTESKDPEPVIIGGPVKTYLDDLEEQANRANTLEELQKISAEQQAVSDLNRKAFQAINGKKDTFERQRLLEIQEQQPIDITPQEYDADHPQVLPLERGWKGRLPEKGKELLYGVNLWQKNYGGWCAELGCWQPIEKKAEWGNYQGRSGWSSWGLDAIGAPRENWQPVFCPVHCDREIPSKLVEIVRMFLITGGRSDFMEKEISELYESAGNSWLPGGPPSAPEPMYNELREHERAIELNMAKTIGALYALQEIRDRNLWRAKAASFDDYCRLRSCDPGKVAQALDLLEGYTPAFFEIGGDGVTIKRDPTDGERLELSRIAMPVMEWDLV